MYLKSKYEHLSRELTGVMSGVALSTVGLLSPLACLSLSGEDTPDSGDDTPDSKLDELD